MQKKTKVINLFAGPCSGKSVTAAGLFFKLKNEGISTEVISEVAKTYAWKGTIPGAFDQIYILGAQAKAESELYGKVDYILTDSPLLLSPIYEYHIEKESVVEESAFKYLAKCKRLGIEHINFLLHRNDKYSEEGRFSTYEEACKIDKAVVEYLRKHKVDFVDVPSINAENKVHFIFDYLCKKN